VTAAPLILVVDDDTDTREMYGWCLEARGFRVALAGSFAAALEQAASETPDLIVTDYFLPGGDGFRLADTLRQNPVMADVAIILVSGRSFHEDALARAARLFNRVLLKPVLPDDLANAAAVECSHAHHRTLEP
jgi:chemotaxis family two-component system response regulator PixH